MNKAVAWTCAAVALQVSAVGWLVWRYERIVQNGTEVRIKCQAYDPYDPLRGRYLRATVVAECTNVLFKVDALERWKKAAGDFCAKLGEVYAKLVEVPGSNGLYRVEAVAREVLDAGLWVKASDVTTRHRLTYRDKKDNESYDDFRKRLKKSGIVADVSFPNQLFVNEKVAPAAEEILRKKSDSAVAVYRAYEGRMVMTDIEIDGKPIISAAREFKKEVR